MSEPSASPESAKDVANKLLKAASHGENLMKEIDYLSTPHAAMPSRLDVLRQMVDSKNESRNLSKADQEFGNVELLDGDGKPVTNRNMAFNIQAIVRTAEDGNKSTLYAASTEPGARSLYNADKDNFLIVDKVEPTHTADVKKLVDGFQQAVDEMVASGHRLSGQGAFMGLMNNIAREDFAGKQYDCVDQAIDVLGRLKKLELEGQWDLHMTGDPPHYTVEAVPHNPNDPIIHMDPWRGRDYFEIKAAGSAPDERVNAWMDEQFRLHWG